ncbi:MAG: serine/threonine protein kinase [Planctomycetaceae bacterium]|jgi:serine/threonine protein kinase
MTASVSDFIVAIGASSLLTADRLSELKSFAEKCTDVERPVNHLVEQKLLTSWQAEMLLHGQTRFFLGRYKLLSLLGQGGMGAVFLAEQTPLARIVALKTMNAQATSTPDAVARFQREIRAAAALDHPNIVRAIDADSANGSHFLVMEYAAGRDLSAVVKESGAMEIADACDCVRQAANGLQHAHERSMVHRDIKPSNLLLTRTEAGLPLVRILDMGLARFTSETTEAGDLTSTGQVMGSIDYISPEQSKDSHSADIRSDIFSLGCTLYFLLTGKAPYPGRNSVQRIMARVMNEAPRVRAARPDIPTSLDELLARILEREPADRIQTPAELAEALRSFCTATGAAAVPMAKLVSTGDATTKLNNLAEAATSHTDAATVIVSADALDGPSESVNSELQNFLNLLTAEARGGNDQAVVDHPPVVAAPITPVPNPIASASASAFSSTASILSRKRGEQRIVYAAAVLCAIAIIAVVFLAKQQSANATHVDHSLSASERNDLDLRIDGRKVAIPKTNSSSFAGDPGQRTVFARRPGFVPIELTLNLKPGETKKVTLRWKKAVDTSLAVNWLRSQMNKLVKTTKSWPPSVANATVRKLRAELIQNLNFTLDADEHRGTADMLRALPGPFDEFPRITMPVDPPLDEGVPLVGVLGANGPRLRHWGQISSLAFSPDGTRFYSAGAGVVKCWSLEDGRLLSWRNCGHAEAKISVSPDGRFLTVTDGPILILDAINLDILAGELPVDSGQFQIAFSRDSQHIAAAFNNGTVTLWTVHGVRVWSQPNLHAGRIDGIDFSSNSRLLATGDVEGRVRVWDAATGELQHTLDGHDLRITALSFFDSNSKLLVSTQDGPLSTWNLNTEPPARTDSADNFMRARISRDGRLLATQFADKLALTDRETG